MHLTVIEVLPNFIVCQTSDLNSLVFQCSISKSRPLKAEEGFGRPKVHADGRSVLLRGSKQSNVGHIL